MLKKHYILLFTLCLCAFASTRALDNVKVYVNGPGTTTKTRIVYQNATLSKLWSAIDAECSTCHPPSIIQDGVNHASRQFSVQNTGNTSAISLAKISVEAIDPQVVKAFATNSTGSELITIAPNETKNFTINYDCNIDGILLNKSIGWTILKVTLLFDGSSSDNKVEFSYQKICTLDTMSRFDFSLVILLTLGTIVVFLGTRHTQTMFAEQAQSADEVKPIHAVFFIVFASMVLLIFYFLKEYILTVVTGLVCISSVSSCALMIHEILEKIGGTDSILHRKVTLPFLGEVAIGSIISFSIAFAIVLAWLITKNWVLNNIIGVCVVLLVLRVVKLSSMKVAMLLLGLAFLYDIFWVFISKPIFGDSVMAYVATSLDLPLKLEWPHFRNTPSKGNCGMLGLGDLVLPGLFVGYCYRFDKARGTNVFHRAAMGSYALGLAICGFFLVVLQLAQPALLYLVPSNIGIVSFVAWKRDLLREIWVGLPHEDAESMDNQGQLISNDTDKATALGEGEEGHYLSELGNRQNNN